MKQKKTVVEYTLTSNEWVHTPGIINWAVSGMTKTQARKFLLTAYPGISALARTNLIERKYLVKGSSVIVEG